MSTSRATDDMSKSRATDDMSKSRATIDMKKSRDSRESLTRLLGFIVAAGGTKILYDLGEAKQREVQD